VNIINHRLHEWPSAYFGVDVSAENIGLLKRHVTARNIAVGGLHVGRIDRLPFSDGYFRIAACVGVLEYYPMEYARAVIREARRVLERRGGFYVDMPNQDHPGFPAMCLVEEHMNRPILLRCPRADFEKLLAGLFTLEGIDATRIMTGFFLRAV